MPAAAEPVILTVNNLAHYLTARGLLSVEAIVDGDLIIADASRRNRNFKVIRKSGPGLFVKQVQALDQQAVATLQREATCYWLAANEPAYAPLAPLAPEFRDFDPLRHVLVIDLVAAAEDLSAYHRRVGKFPPAVGAALGRLLGTYHRDVRMQPDDERYKSVFPGAVPWILSAHQHNQFLGGTGAAGSQVLGIVGQYPEFPAALEALKNGWQVNGLMHGDVKWDNSLIYAGDGKPLDDDPDEGEIRLKMIDWEIADFGDIYWDAGAVFQSYLFFWVLSMPASAEMTGDELVDKAHFRLEEMQPAIRAFWRTYADVLGVPAATAAGLLERCVQYGAARMIQTAYEASVYSPQMSANVLYLLQMSLNVLTRPRDAIRDLLAL